MPEIKLWKNRDKKIIDPTLYSDIAEQMAKEMKNDLEMSRRRVNKRTQIRKFYDEVVRLDTEAKRLDMNSDNGREKWDNILPMVHMLVAKAAYARGRDLVSQNFSDFIRSSVKQVSEPVDLSVFANFFEAFMGFYRLYETADLREIQS